MEATGPKRDGEGGGGVGLLAAVLAGLGVMVGLNLGRGGFGVLVGGVFGFLIAYWIQVQRQLRQLAESSDELRARIVELERAGALARMSQPGAAASETDEAAPGAPASTTPEGAAPDDAPPSGPSRPSARSVSTVRPSPPVPSVSPGPPGSPVPSARPERVTAPAPRPARRAQSIGDPDDEGAPQAIDGPIAYVVHALRSFLFGGNTVVRVGVVVLLVGVALLVRYAVESALFPIELRLAFAALIGLALAVLGQRVSATRPGFGISLQGGGIAALYLVVFFAFRVYALVPASMAFVLFVATALGCGVLSVRQSAQPLLVIGSVGGFAAPLLASTGGGSHVFLFGFYLVLNAGIAAVAWFRGWRLPPLIAFIATYGVAAVWGVLRYRSQDWATTQPFVIAFLLLFTGVAIMRAFRERPQLRSPVDGALVFGAPLLSLLAQARLVEDMEFGLAISTVVLAIGYTALARWLWRVQTPGLRPLAEAFIALGVGFATMAIPLAFETSLTVTVAWALEGAGLYWIGVRQQRRLARYAGLALHVLAALAFFVSVAVHDFQHADFVILANGRFLSCLALALAGFVIGRQADVHRDRLRGFEWRLAQIFGALGLLWWAVGVVAEIDQFVTGPWQLAAGVGAAGLSAVGVEALATWRGWQTGRALALAVLPVLGLLLLGALEGQPHLLAHGGWLAWPFALGAVHLVVGRLASDGPGWAPRAYAPAFWLLVLTVGLALGGIVEVPLALTRDWGRAAVGLGAASVCLAVLGRIERERGVWGRHAEVYLGLGMSPLAGLALLWWIGTSSSARGDSSPLPHVPILNPVDASLGLVAVATLVWWRAVRRHPAFGITPENLRAAIAVGAAALFLWLNTILVRAVHQWGDVPFDRQSLWDSVALQSSLSIMWTLVALGGMLASTRRGLREPWMVFAGLLGVVVAKLFLVDLSQLSTVARIATFLVVGVLLLIVGYFTPVPPSRPDGRADADRAATADRDADVAGAETDAAGESV
jgi:uncharacterized membrane protein